MDLASDPERVAQAVDELIELYELFQEADRSLKEYVAHNAPPETPELFEDVESLLRYNAEKARYDVGLSRLMQRGDERAADYSRASARVEPLLPEGARLVHTYGGSSKRIPAGKRYYVYKERELMEDISEAGVVAQATQTGEVSAVAYVVRVEELVTSSG